MVDVTIEMYDYFYSKYYQAGMGIPRSERNLKIVENFLRLVDADGITVGINWLFDYNAFQFNRMMKMKFGSIQINYVYGKKAYSYWQNRPDGWSRYMIQDFLKSRGIIKERAIDLIMYDKDEKEVEDFNPIDERIKRVHDCNFVACVSFTSLWNPRSEHCMKCSNKVRCKKLLRQTNYQLYKSRIDELERRVPERSLKGKRI